MRSKLHDDAVAELFRSDPALALEVCDASTKAAKVWLDCMRVFLSFK